MQSLFFFFICTIQETVIIAFVNLLSQWPKSFAENCSWVGSDDTSEGSLVNKTIKIRQ